jgi:uncharacterized protein YndB with AHSA1/START domain
MAISLDVEVAIARPPSEVFAHLTAVERWPEWLIASGIVGVRRAGDAGPLTTGSVFVIDQRVAGRAATLDARVTAMEAPTRFAVSGRDADGVTVDIDALMRATDRGTALRWQLRIGLPFRYRWLESMAKPQVQRAATLDLEAFRRRLDSIAEG